MKVEFINPFINATRKVLSTMAFMESKAGKPFVKKEVKASGIVSALIKLSGGTRGSVAISFSQNCVLGIATNMMGETFDEINQDILDMVGEMCNMISGEARRELAELGFQFTAGIPETSKGDDHNLEHGINGPTILIPFITQNGKFFIEACFESPQYFTAAIASQKSEENATDKNNSLTQIEIQSIIKDDAPKFKAYLLKPNSQNIKTDFFLIDEYVSAKEGFDTCNYLKLEVFVCPETYFASNKLNQFIHSYSPSDEILQEDTVKKHLAPILSKMSMLWKLPDSFYSHNRTIEQGIRAFDLAIFTSNALLSYDADKFANQHHKIAEYSLKGALLSKIQVNVQREIKYLKSAFGTLKKILPTQAFQDQFRTLYLLIAIGVYVGDTQSAKKYFDQIFHLYREEFPNIKDHKVHIDLKEYMELAKKTWSTQEQLNIKKLRNQKNYLFLK